MAKKKSRSSKKKLIIKEQKSVSYPFWYRQKWHNLILFFLAILLFANTLGHNYTQDDAIVIYDNMFTQDGFSGIPGLLSNDTFYGFFKEEGKANLVSGGRYRPLTPVMFAIEWALFGRSPFIGHLLNVLMYALLGIMLYKLLSLLFNKKKDSKLSFFIFLASVIYIAHPLHTEVVANIKGRDEIMTMLGSVSALWFALKHFDTKKTKFLIYSILSFFLALMSKENAITFLAIVPISFMLFRGVTFFGSLKKTIPLFISAAIFLLIRFSILGMDFGGAPLELMNNPFLKFVNSTWVPFDFSEKIATIFFTLGKYLQLLIFPHSLSHDYYPRAIDIMSFGDWKVLLSVFAYSIMIFVAFKSWKKDKYISFGILFYLITLSIVSNIIFPVGTNMGERFLFMPSLGFAIVFARLLTKHIQAEKLILVISTGLILAYSFKTINRNQVWKDDFKLFTSDVSSQTRSAKLLNAAGGALSNEAAKLQDGPQKNKMLNEAITHLQKAITIHPTYRNAYLLLGNSYYYSKRYKEAIEYYDRCLQISPGYGEVMKNFPIVLREGGKHMGQVTKDFDQAQAWLTRAYNMNPQDFETCRLLGITFGIKKKHLQAIEYFQKALTIKPNSAVVLASMGTAYLNLGDRELAINYFNQAQAIDPNALNHLQKK